MKKVISIVLILLILILVILFSNQKVSEGYIVSKKGTEIMVVGNVSKEDIKGKNKEEMEDFLKQKALASPSNTSFYNIPLVNRIIKAKLNEGDKVKIYWYGEALQSAPAKVKGTTLILKNNK